MDNVHIISSQPSLQTLSQREICSRVSMSRTYSLSPLVPLVSKKPLSLPDQVTIPPLWNFKQKPTHVSADRMVFVLFGVNTICILLFTSQVFFLNSKACYISPALSSFEIHREIIFIKLKKNYPSHDYIALTRWQTSIQFVSGLRTGASTQVFYSSYMYFCEQMIFECMISKIHTLLHHFSQPYTTDHTI